MPGELPALLTMAFRAVIDEIHGRLAEDGFGDVRPAHGFAFHYLSWHPDATAAQLGEHLGMTKQASVQLVEELERRGYVERRPHPTDRRARAVILTRRGRDCIDRFVALATEAEDRWAALVGADRLQVMRECLSEYVSAAGHPPLRPTW